MKKTFNIVIEEDEGDQAKAQRKFEDNVMRKKRKKVEYKYAFG